MRKLLTTFLLFITGVFGVYSQVIEPYSYNISNGYGGNKFIYFSFFNLPANDYYLAGSLNDPALQANQSYSSNGYFTYTRVNDPVDYRLSSNKVYLIKNSIYSINLPYVVQGAYKIHFIEINPTDGKHYRMFSSQVMINHFAIQQLITPGEIAGDDTLCKNSLIGKITSVSPAGNKSLTTYEGLDVSKFTFLGYEWDNLSTGLELDYGTSLAQNILFIKRKSKWVYDDMNNGIYYTFDYYSNTVTKTVMDCAVFSPNIIGATTIIPNQTTSYSVAGQTGMRYTWTVTGGTILSGQGTNSISVLWDGSGLSQARVAGNSYTVSVVETNANNVSNTLSSAITLTTTGTTSAMQAAGISVFPNPCQNQVSVSMPESNVEVEYTIYSLRGEAVQSGRFVSSGTSNVITNQLSAGMYQLVLSYQGQRVQTALSVTE